MLGDAEVAHDTVADVFASIWRLRAEWRPAHGIAAYLFGAVRHRVANAARGARRAGRCRRRWADLYVAPALGAAPEPADAALERREEADALAAALRTLPLRAQLVLALRWEQGLSFAQIGEALGTTEAAAKMQVHRALKALKDRVSDHLK